MVREALEFLSVGLTESFANEKRSVVEVICNVDRDFLEGFASRITRQQSLDVRMTWCLNRNV